MVHLYKMFFLFYCFTTVRFARITLEIIMAAKDALTQQECAVIANALGLYRQSLMRAQNKEIAGSEIHSVRARQIQEVDVIIAKSFSLS